MIFAKFYSLIYMNVSWNDLSIRTLNLNSIFPTTVYKRRHEKMNLRKRE